MPEDKKPRKPRQPLKDGKRKIPGNDKGHLLRSEQRLNEKLRLQREGITPGKVRIDGLGVETEVMIGSGGKKRKLPPKNKKGNKLPDGDKLQELRDKNNGGKKYRVPTFVETSPEDERKIEMDALRIKEKYGKGGRELLQSESLNPAISDVGAKEKPPEVDKSGVIPLLQVVNKLTGNWLGKIAGAIGIDINYKGTIQGEKIEMSGPSSIKSNVDLERVKKEGEDLEKQWAKSKMDAAPEVLKIKKSGGVGYEKPSNRKERREEERKEKKAEKKQRGR